MVESLKHIHFIGIGGAGMSGIAKVLLEKGFKVSGSDLKESKYTKVLKSLGADTKIGHGPDNINNPDIVVISSAIPDDNSELVEAQKRQIKIIRRAEMLAWLGKDSRSIAIAGTHGKTTTTSMISLMFEKLGLDPTFLIGGELNDIGSNAKYGNGEFFITEADESDGSLLYLNPEIVVITNIEADHLDYYKSLQEIEDLFYKFVDSVSDEGFIVACVDNLGVQRLIQRSNKKFITYGLDEAEIIDNPELGIKQIKSETNKSHLKIQIEKEFTAKNIKLEMLGSNFDVYRDDKFIAKVKLNVPGIHNIYNALAALALGMSLKFDLNKIVEALHQFSGVKRRFQIIGTTSEFTLVDDYAHHPTEVKATLNAAKSGEWQRLICVFQPHRYSRTKFLGKEFGSAFDDADVVVLTDIYAAGEEPIPGVTGKVIVDAVLSRNPKKQVVYLPKKSEIPKFLQKIVREGDLILTLGAGDIYSAGEDFLAMACR